MNGRRFILEKYGPKWFFYCNFRQRVRSQMVIEKKLDLQVMPIHPPYRDFTSRILLKLVPVQVRSYRNRVLICYHFHLYLIQSKLTIMNRNFRNMSKFGVPSRNDLISKLQTFLTTKEGCAYQCSCYKLLTYQARYRRSFPGIGHR